MRRVSSAYILAGGQSSRFGENKALVSVRGEPQIVRLARQLASDGLQVRLVSQRASDYQDLGIPTIEDRKQNSGPFAGVIAALQNSAELADSWCIICSCDMLEWRAEWRSAWEGAIWDGAIEEANDWDVAILSNDDDLSDSFRPFPGLYRVSLLDQASKLWESGIRSMRGFHQAVGRRVRVCQMSQDLLPKCFNTPSELAELMKKND